MFVSYSASYQRLLLALLRHYHKGTLVGLQTYACANVWQRCCLHQGHFEFSRHLSPAPCMQMAQGTKLLSVIALIYNCRSESLASGLPIITLLKTVTRVLIDQYLRLRCRSPRSTVR